MRPKDAELWKRATAIVTKSYGTTTSAYRSMAIAKKYKELGGTYHGKKDTTKGVKRWLDEQWIKVIPFIQENKKIACGASERRKHACRPFKRISRETPPTINELIKQHGKEKLIRLAKAKRKGTEQTRVNWKTATKKTLH